jgi:glycosyltransferase involved in cell wall biosynthesis
MPIVSVIIPSYNRDHLLPETLNSALNQSFRDYEVIVIDDGSTDNTREVVSNFPVKYIRQENQGLPNARNTGIKAAQGQYIAILDSDDCLLSNSLEKRVKVLESHPEVAFVYGQTYLMDESSRIIGMTKSPFNRSCIRPGKTELHDLLYVNHVPASTVMIRRICLDRVGMFNPSFIHGQEDLEMWVRLSTVFDSAYIAEPLIKLRVHTNRMTGQLAIETFENNHKMIIDSVFNNPELGLLFSAERNKIYSYLYLFMAEVAYMRRAMKELRSYVIKAIKLYPRLALTRTGFKWMSLFTLTLAPQFIFDFVRSVKHSIQIKNHSRLKPVT